MYHAIHICPLYISASGKPEFGSKEGTSSFNHGVNVASVPNAHFSLWKRPEIIFHAASLGERLRFSLTFSSRSRISWWIFLSMNTEPIGCPRILSVDFLLPSLCRRVLPSTWPSCSSRVGSPRDEMSFRTLTSCIYDEKTTAAVTMKDTLTVVPPPASQTRIVSST